MKIDWIENTAREIEFTTANDSRIRFRTKEAILRFLKYLYVIEGLTVREICELTGTRYTVELAKTFYAVFKKNKRGGARKGAGNKKGIKFCKECRKALHNCNCSLKSKHDGNFDQTQRFSSNSGCRLQNHP